MWIVASTPFPCTKFILWWWLQNGMVVTHNSLSIRSTSTTTTTTLSMVWYLSYIPYHMYCTIPYLKYHTISRYPCYFLTTSYTSTRLTHKSFLFKNEYVLRDFDYWCVMCMMWDRLNETWCRVLRCGSLWWCNCLTLMFLTCSLSLRIRIYRCKRWCPYQASVRGGRDESHCWGKGYIWVHRFLNYSLSPCP